MARSAKPKGLAKYRTSAGTPNEMQEATHVTPSEAKGWLMSRVNERIAWGERYSWAVRDEAMSIKEKLSVVMSQLSTAKSGREWEWRAIDDVSKVQFVFRIEVL